MVTAKMNTGGFIALHRKIMTAPFYTNPLVCHLAIHLLLSACHRDTKVLIKGVVVCVKRGQVIKSRSALAEETGLSQQNIRTALKLLEDCEFLTIVPTKELTKQVTKESTKELTKHPPTITITNYDSYQFEISEGNQTSNQTINQRSNQTINQSLTKDQPNLSDFFPETCNDDFLEANQHTTITKKSGFKKPKDCNSRANKAAIPPPTPENVAMADVYRKIIKSMPSAIMSTAFTPFLVKEIIQTTSDDELKVWAYIVQSRDKDNPAGWLVRALSRRRYTPSDSAYEQAKRERDANCVINRK
jgi:hypothetical protein